MIGLFVLLLTAAAKAQDSSSEVREAPAVKVVYGDEGRIVLSALERVHLTLIEDALEGSGAISELLQVYVGKPNDDSQPMLGSFSVDASSVVFKPRFGLSRKIGYTIRVRLPAIDSTKEIVRDQFVKASDEHAVRNAKVSAIYPSHDTLPDNLLKFYICFSEPMSRGNVYDHIELVDRTSDSVVEMPFLEIQQELWNADQTRLTLLFDPGRIKRGLMPREKFGPPLKPGGKYLLRVKDSWKDAEGQQLLEAVEKNFEVVVSDQMQPKIFDWQVTLPKTESLDALTIIFDEPLDRAMLAHSITILHKGEQIVGVFEVNLDETRIKFTPDNNWIAGEYVIRVDNRLEDVAGNSIGRAFEVADKALQQESMDAYSEFSFRIPLRVR